MNDLPLNILEGQTGPEGAPVAASIIVLHGLGADGSDFVPIAQAMDLSAVGPVRWVFPSAPVRPVTLNGGYAMRAWFDIHPPRPDGTRLEDVAGLRESQAAVQQLLDREAMRGVPPERTVLMGFSQGCAMTLLAGLRAPRRLAGLVALSGYLPLADSTALHVAMGLRWLLGDDAEDRAVSAAQNRASLPATRAGGAAVTAATP